MKIKHNCLVRELVLDVVEACAIIFWRENDYPVLEGGRGKFRP